MWRIFSTAATVVVAHAIFASGAINLDDPAEPWKTARAGITNKVPPPFEALKKTGATVTCWGRSYTLTGLFPEKISSAGKKILVGPITLTVKSRDGSAVRSENFAAGKPKFTLQRPDRIEWTGAGTTAKFDWRSKCWIEYDGVMRVELTLKTAKPVKVDHLVISIPLNPDFDLYHSHSQWAKYFFRNVGGKEGTKVTAPWQGCSWIGDDYRGLTFISETAAGWTGTEKAFKIIRERDRLLLRVSIWRKPVDFVGERTFVFGLQATPPKPLPFDWHGRHIGTWSEYVNVRYIWFSTEKWFSYPQEERPGSITDVVKRYHKQGSRALLYITPSGTGPESDVFKRHRDQWLLDDGKGKPLIRDGGVEGKKKALYGVCPVSSYTDWMAWAIDKGMGEYDIDGIYIDNSHVYPCLNKRHGCGAEGVRTYPFFANREWHKRLYTIVRRHKPKKGFVVQHHSQSFNSFSLGFVDMYIHGEQFRNLKGWKLDLDRDINRTFMRIGFTGRQWGAQACFLPSLIAIEGHHYTDWLLARTLPWGNVLLLHTYWMDSSLETPVLRARHEFGLGREKVEWFTPADMPPSWLAIRPDHLLVGGYIRKDGGTLITISNIRKEKTVARFKVKPLERQFGKNFEISDALTKVPVTFKPKFGVKVVVNDNSFRVLRIGKAANRVR